MECLDVDTFTRVKHNKQRPRPETTDLNFLQHADRAQATILFVLARPKDSKSTHRGRRLRRTCRPGRIGYLDSMFFLDRCSIREIDGFGAWAIRHILSLRLIAGERQREGERKERTHRPEKTDHARHRMGLSCSRDSGLALSMAFYDMVCPCGGSAYGVHRTPKARRGGLAGWLAYYL